MFSLPFFLFHSLSVSLPSAYLQINAEVQGWMDGGREGGKEGEKVEGRNMGGLSHCSQTNP